MKRYEKLADEITNLIRSEVLKIGDKIPSVRQACQTYRVSPSTVFQAYYFLENKGLILAKARSGYFVRDHMIDVLQEPEIFSKTAHITDVNISELVFSVLDLLRHPQIIPFGSAFPSPDLFPSERLSKSMTKSLKQLSTKAIISSMTAGDQHLRRQIAVRYMKNAVPVDKEELVITNGAMEALNLCLQAVTEPNDLVAIEAPAFYATLQSLERLKLKAVEIPVHPREGIDLNVLEDVLERLPIKACWFMSNLHNPMGASMSESKKQRLSELIEKFQIPLIEDDVYAELYYDQPLKPVKSFDKKGLVMHCGSFSKCLAPGYRVGWVAGGRYMQKINQLKLMSSISPSVPAQAAIADYLEYGGYDRYLRKLRYLLMSQQDAMLSAISRYFPKNVKVTKPNGGYFLWVQCHEKVDSLLLFNDALAQGISLVPGPIFSATHHFRHCFRLNYGYPWSEDFEQAMQTLGQLLHQY
ncbi:PLP-dependent aminotransferase family protein [Neisseria sp. Ec49-e6-T10]|uniref:aminotransferase-like domain-containing protein n=1 Tax=Neisseria sp. Ec49-e6-T10 TaxID=3140744 RepID=UPI003EBFB8DF